MKNSKTNKTTNVRACRRCKGAVELSSLYDYCPDCLRIVEDVFTRIKDYLHEYPGATAFEIELETGIPYHVINTFVREGRLVEIENIEFVNIECKGCGRLLLSVHHTYCPDCRKRMQEEMENIKNEFQRNSSDKAKMHLKITRKED
ncbi:MAG: hypothetical protein ACOYVK_12040 [Bacillota bacterium]